MIFPYRSSILFVLCLIGPTSTSWAQHNALLCRNLQHAQTLAAAGLKPVQVIDVGKAQFGLSNPVRLDDSHQIAVTWITIDSEKAIRVLYRSNSQCCWRYCDAATSNHIGKGFHEFDKQVPIDVTMALLRAASKIVELKAWFEPGETEITQEMLAHKLLRLLTVDRDLGLQSGDVVTIGDSYVTREYASNIPCLPVPFSTVRGHLTAAGGGRIADPSKTELPPPNRLPDLSTEVASVQFSIPSYARFVGGSGRLTGRVYLSRDTTTKYLFIEDENQRVMLSTAELIAAPVSLLGVRTRYLDTSGMDTPLMEYGAQIPEQFGGRKKYRYQSAWQLVRQLPIVVYYYGDLHRPIPPAQAERNH